MSHTGKVCTTTKKKVVKAGHFAHFTPRSKMKPMAHARRFAMSQSVLPSTPLPVDGTGNAKVSCPMDGNDTLGDCGPVMCAHVDNILTFGQGQPGFIESSFNLAALEAQYEKYSGGDNGTDEQMLVGSGGIWIDGIAGNSAAICVASLDIPNDAATLQYCIDQFYAVEMAWSVPDAFLNEFTTGASFLQPMTPDPANGHYTPLADVDAHGNYRLWTWGGWCWVSPSFVNSVQPDFFVAFSPRQFSPTTGLDSKGRHITVQAAKWAAMGGTPISSSVLAAFPPASGPIPPVNPPTPVGPPPVPATHPLFSVTVPRSIRQNGRVVFSAPVPIPAGSYPFGPAASSTAMFLETEEFTTQHAMLIHSMGKLGLPWAQILAWIEQYGLGIAVQLVPYLGQLAGLTPLEIAAWVTQALAAIAAGQPIPAPPTA